MRQRQERKAIPSVMTWSPIRRMAARCRTLTSRAAPPKDGVSERHRQVQALGLHGMKAEMKATVDQVNFDVIEEDGKPVINDIHRVGDEGRDSVQQEMANIIKGE